MHKPRNTEYSKVDRVHQYHDFFHGRQDPVLSGLCRAISLNSKFVNKPFPLPSHAPTHPKMYFYDWMSPGLALNSITDNVQ